jgi:hypothetical protein
MPFPLLLSFAARDSADEVDSSSCTKFTDLCVARLYASLRYVQKSAPFLRTHFLLQHY